MQIEELYNLANFYGYNIQEINQQKYQGSTKIYSIADRRTGNIIIECSLSDPKLKAFFDNFKPEVIEERKRKSEDLKQRYYNQPQHQIDMIEEQLSF